MQTNAHNRRRWTLAPRAEAHRWGCKPPCRSPPPPVNACAPPPLGRRRTPTERMPSTISRSFSCHCLVHLFHQSISSAPSMRLVPALCMVEMLILTHPHRRYACLQALTEEAGETVPGALHLPSKLHPSASPSCI